MHIQVHIHIFAWLLRLISKRISKAEHEYMNMHLSPINAPGSAMHENIQVLPQPEIT